MNIVVDEKISIFVIRDEIVSSIILGEKIDAQDMGVYIYYIINKITEQVKSKYKEKYYIYNFSYDIDLDGDIIHYRLELHHIEEFNRNGKLNELLKK